MKKVLLVCLLAFSMNAVAQCPIDEILTTRDPQNIATLIENNTDCIKQSLTQNPEYQNFKVYIDYLYNTSSPWVYHTNPEKEKIFNNFYATWARPIQVYIHRRPHPRDFTKPYRQWYQPTLLFLYRKKQQGSP
jgi:hypothetical protein